MDVRSKLENAGSRLSERESELFRTEIERIGHKIDQNGIQPLQDELLAIKELQKPENEKELKSFRGQFNTFPQILKTFQLKQTFRNNKKIPSGNGWKTLKSNSKI